MVYGFWHACVCVGRYLFCGVPKETAARTHCDDDDSYYYQMTKIVKIFIININVYIQNVNSNVANVFCAFFPLQSASNFLDIACMCVWNYKAHGLPNSDRTQHIPLMHQIKQSILALHRPFQQQSKLFIYMQNTMQAH